MIIVIEVNGRHECPWEVPTRGPSATVGNQVGFLTKNLLDHQEKKWTPGISEITSSGDILYTWKSSCRKDFPIHMVKWDTLVVGALTHLWRWVYEFSFSSSCFLNFRDFLPWTYVIFSSQKMFKNTIPTSVFPITTATITAKATSYVFLREWSEIMNLRYPALSAWYVVGTQTKAVPSLTLICINVVPNMYI